MTPTAPPRLATVRNPARPTRGPKLAAIGRVLGRPLMPWQRLVADTALEIAPSGFYQYRTVVLVVPRQQGKSVLLQCLMVLAALRAYDQTIIYTAQDRGEARRRLLVELDERTLARSPTLRGRYRTRRTNGDEHITFPTGSSIGIVAPTDTAGHGQTLDLGVIDEAFAHRDLSLPQAFGPAMVTRRNAQLWVVSVVGDGTDYLLQHYQTQGERSLDDPDTRIAFFEWSAPDGDVYDVDTWRGCMPALGLTVDVDDVRADPTYADPAEFARAYLCRRPEPAASSPLDADEWIAGTVATLPLRDPLVFAADVSIDRTSAAIGAASALGDGGPVGVEVLDHRPGTSWVLPRLVELAARHHPVAVVIDGGGPIGAQLVAMERARLPLVVLNGPDVTRACGLFVDASRTGALRHLAQGPLDDAVAAAAKSHVGDRFRWARRNAIVDLSPLYAVTLAHHGVLTGPPLPVVASA
jgi:hypothetical protein